MQVIRSDLPLIAPNSDTRPHSVLNMQPGDIPMALDGYRLEHADDQLAAVELLGQGYGLHWEELDVDLSLPGLMAGLFGTKAWMARRAGQATSAAKAAAARANGAKGGRPRKSAKR